MLSLQKKIPVGFYVKCLLSSFLYEGYLEHHLNKQ